MGDKSGAARLWTTRARLPRVHVAERPGNLWHTDKSCRPEPLLAAIPHAITMPPDGGDTCFAEERAKIEALEDHAGRHQRVQHRTCLRGTTPL